MNKILVLTRNEYKKLFGKVSSYILLAILLILIFLISLIKPYSYTMDSDWKNYWINDNIEMRQYQIEALNMELTNATPGQKVLFLVEIAVLENQIELIRQTEALGIKNYDDWRLQYIYQNIDYEEYIYTYEYILEHPEDADILSQRYYIDEQSYNEYKQKRVEIERILKDNNYAETKREYYNSSLSDLKESKIQLEEAIKQKDTAKDGEFKVFVLKGVVFALEQKVEVFELFFKNKYEYHSDPEQTVSIAIDSYSRVADEYRGFHSKAEYNAIIDSMSIQELSFEYLTNNYRDKKSYEEYYSDTMERINNFSDKGLVASYALNNDVTETTIANDARQKSLSFFGLFWIIAPFAVFFASSMVSREFSARTINLLLIRPAKRWKVLLSKYLCVTSFALGTAVLSAGVYLLGVGLSFGFADFAGPHIYVANGIAQSMSFMVFFVGKVLVAFLSVLALVSITFMFSTLIKSTATSLILGIFTMLSSVFILFVEIFVNIKTLTYLPFPYLSIWSYVLNDTTFLVNDEYSIFAYVFNTNLTYGAWVMVGLTLLALTISLVRFEKMDIK